jgi:protein gp37
MSDHSKIEWTDATWNPVIGCTKVSPGCDHCYAIRTAHRMQANPNEKVSAAYAGTESDGAWTGQVNLLEDRLNQPLRWAKPRRIFVNSQSDLFHDQVPDEFVARVFAVMAAARHHTFQVLTKRHGRMRALLSSPDFTTAVAHAFLELPRHQRGSLVQYPLPNVWLGVSVENQQWADIRIPALLETPAAVRFLSCEPLLGPVDMRWRVTVPRYDAPRIHWVIVGGESGPGARPMHPEWARSLRNQCTDAGIAFSFKQWGEYTKVEHRHAQDGDVWVLGGWGPYRDELMRRVGKKAAGRVLDGRTWDEFPEAVTR